jgi:hypothetical protein
MGMDQNPYQSPLTFEPKPELHLKPEHLPGRSLGCLLYTIATICGLLAIAFAVETIFSLMQEAVAPNDAAVQYGVWLLGFIVAVVIFGYLGYRLRHYANTPES